MFAVLGLIECFLVCLKVDNLVAIEFDVRLADFGLNGCKIDRGRCFAVGFGLTVTHPYIKIIFLTLIIRYRNSVRCLVYLAPCNNY